jgi:hypothetical protein
MMGAMRRAVLMVLLAACGDDGVRHTPDAAPHDGPATDAPADAAGDPVTLTATRNGIPVPGVHVFFQNSDSSIVSNTTTDDNGTASAVMAAGGYVTAVDPYALPALGATASNDVMTFVHVKPGDHLRLSEGSAATFIAVNISAPFDPAATTESVYASCGHDPAQLSPPAQAVVAQVATAQMQLMNCGAATNFLLVSYDQNSQPLNMAYLTNIAVTDGGAVDLTAATFVGVDTKTWTFNNGPALTSLSFQDVVVDPLGAIFSTGNETPSDQQNPSVTMPVATVTGAMEVVQTSFQTTSSHTLLDWGPYSSTFTTDVGARALADFTGVPSFDPATHTESITEAATGATADFSLTFLIASRPSDNHQWLWEVSAPHGTSITLPHLPTDVYDFNIVATDNVTVEAWINGQVPGGYDAVRAFLLSTTGPADLIPLPVAGTGTAAVVQYSPPSARAVRFRSRDTMAHAPVLGPRVLSGRVR